jgi:hypothetical protein
MHRNAVHQTSFDDYYIVFSDRLRVLHLLCRRRRLFCTYCVEFNSYNYPNILFQTLSTL